MNMNSKFIYLKNRHNLKLYCTLVFFFFVKFTNAQMTNETDTFCKQIVLAFQSKDFNVIQRLLINAQEINDEIIPQIITDSVHKIPDSLIEKGKNFYQKDLNQKLNKKIFDSILNDGAELGIKEWGAIKFEKFQSSIIVPHRNPDNIRLSGDIFFMYNNELYGIYGIMASKLHSG